MRTRKRRGEGRRIGRGIKEKEEDLEVEVEEDEKEEVEAKTTQSRLPFFYIFNTFSFLPSFHGLLFYSLDAICLHRLCVEEIFPPLISGPR